MLVVTVCGALTLEVVALHTTSKALALADGRHVNLLALFKDVSTDLLTDGERRDILQAQLNESLTRGNARLVKVSALRLGHRVNTTGAPGDLDCGVALFFRRLDLHDTHRANPDNGHRNGTILVVPDLGHAHLLADDRLGRHVLSP